MCSKNNIYNNIALLEMCQAIVTLGVHFTLVHRYDFITGKRADIRRGDS